MAANPPVQGKYGSISDAKTSWTVISDIKLM